MVFRVFFGLVNLGFLVGLIAALGSAADNCDGEVGATLEACEAGTAIGGGAILVFIVFLWVAVDLILYVLHRVFRRKPKTAVE